MAPPKGFVPWNKGKKGVQVWSDESRRKASLSHMGNKSHLGRTFTAEHRANISKGHLGITKSDAAREKLSQALKGRVFTEEWREKISKSLLEIPTHEKQIMILKGKIKRYGKFVGENNHRFKKDIPRKYCAKFNAPFRERVRLFFQVCVECGAIGDWQKLHVHHVNNDKQTMCNGSPKLFVTLCRTCHGHTRNHKLKEHYQEKYTNLINTKYKGKCYLTTEEYLEMLNNKLKELENQNSGDI